MNNSDEQNKEVLEKAMKDYTWIDIPTMHDLSEEQYSNFIKQTFGVDHHDVLRLYRGSDEAPPLATTLEQLDLIISYLDYLREKMIPKNGR